ncbi:Gfo/Idh/MocA family protein [Thermoflavimicrobium dichotomicum]|uniref:Predicted dehydrogenase n=1 Tax=Thermoflavimicrobium dichotomicum TaxID=46223 RepID=A0A1I3S790_9BACL|nr:Gfo/Idh/MocA family oxidoreductase [Thermoflavimicrobium dichotomicum]SFJ53427.1 Predicted dehydrogenase [Thermoflavimicrobium dichotomicum]
MSQTVKFGIVGAGGISEAHLKAIQKEPRVVVGAIADVVKEVAIGQAGKYQIPNVYQDYREMLENDDLDAVIICVPNFLHAPVAIDALKAGKHVLSEKPMALNSELAKQMIETADQTGKVLMIAQNNRFHAETTMLKKWIAENKLGQIYHAKTGWVRRNGIPGWGSWFTQKELSGGGALIDVGVHVLDLTLWLMDFPKPVSVMGKTYDVFGPEKKKLLGYGKVVDQGSYNVEDLAVAMIQFEEGSSLVLDASWASHIAQERVYVSLYGKEGGAELDLFHKKLTLYTDSPDGPVDQISHLPPEDERLNLLKHFVDVIEGKAEPICKPEQSLLVQQILDAIYQSAEKGELIRF